MKPSSEASPTLRLAYLYPEVMNLYADRGNVMTLAKRCAWRDIALKIDEVAVDETLEPQAYDMIFIGGGQDREQRLIAPDLLKNKAALERMAASGVVMLAVCGGFQLFGRVYRPAQGEAIEGIGVLDMETVSGNKRLIGNVVIDSMLDDFNGTLVGFENHSGKTYLGPKARALGKIIHGNGNNAEDGLEGATQGNVFGTYLHGSLLPKNPAFADHLITLALKRRYPDYSLLPLDDSLENAAHVAAIERTRQVGRSSRLPQWLRRF